MTAPDVTLNDIAEAELAEDATAWDKRMQALTMRNAGGTYARIAETFGISIELARKWVHQATRDVVKMPVDQMVDRQRAILLDITRVNYPAAMDKTNPEHREAQSTIIRCLEHEAKLYGLYAPARVSVGISESEFGQQAADLLKLVGVGPLAELAGIGRAELEAAIGQRPATDPPVNRGSTVNGTVSDQDILEGEVLECPIGSTPDGQAAEVLDDPWSNI